MPRYLKGKLSVIGVLTVAVTAATGLLAALPPAQGQVTAPKPRPTLAVGPQYDATHVYVQHGTLRAFVKSWEATFGGTNSTPALSDVTPTASQTHFTVLLSPVGSLSVFDYQTRPAPRFCGDPTTAAPWTPPSCGSPAAT